MPPDNLVEAHITRVSGGSKEQFMEKCLLAFARTTVGKSLRRLSFLPIPEIWMGPQKGLSYGEKPNECGRRFLHRSYRTEAGWSTSEVHERAKREENKHSQTLLAAMG